MVLVISSGIRVHNAGEAEGGQQRCFVEVIFHFSFWIFDFLFVFT